jgi:glc operon protein GlcG
MIGVARSTAFLAAALFIQVACQAQTPPAPPPAPPFGVPVTYSQAQSIVASAISRAAELGVPNTIAVTEPSGDLVYLVRMDGAPYSAAALAQQKAWDVRAL